MAVFTRRIPVAFVRKPRIIRPTRNYNIIVEKKNQSDILYIIMSQSSRPQTIFAFYKIYTPHDFKWFTQIDC